MSANEAQEVSDREPISGVFNKGDEACGLAELLAMSRDADALKAVKEGVCGRPIEDAMVEIARVEALIDQAAEMVRGASQLPSAYPDRKM